MNGPMTVAQVQGLPAVVDLRTAARALGIGRTLAYELARTGQFPCPLIKVGNQYRVPTAGLLRILGLSPQPVPAAEPPFLLRSGDNVIPGGEHHG